MNLELEITGIAAGGAGVGRLPDGRVTFVNRTAPGDRARVRVTEAKRRWTRSELVTLLRASPDRRDAPCPHYERCGGCTLEHLSYAAQLRAKAGIVANALRRIGGLRVAEPTVTPSPMEFRYRNRVTFTLRRTPDGVVAGFRELDRPDQVLDVTGSCLLPEEPLARAWADLRAAWGPGAARLPSGSQIRLTLRASAAGDVSLAVDGGYAGGRPDELLAAVRALRSVWHRPARAVDFLLVAGHETLPERWAGEEVELSGDVFTQVNRSAAALLEDHVVSRVIDTGLETVVDAYCGVGLYARRLAREGLAVVGIEAHADALSEARRAAPGASFLEGKVEARLPEALPVDGVILNPPRAGLDARVPGLLRSHPPERVLYVSCDPATLARDLGRFADTFRLASVHCFDLFPQTAHVETVVELEPTARPPAGGPG